MGRDLGNLDFFKQPVRWISTERHWEELGEYWKGLGITGSAQGVLGQHWEGLGNIGLNGLCPGRHWINTGKNWGVLGTVGSAQGSTGKP